MTSGREEAKRRVSGPASIAVSLAISIICLVLAAQRVSWTDFVEAFVGVSLSWLGIAIVLQFATMALRAYRWKTMFLERIPYADVFWTQAVGYLVNNVLPLRLGDFARILLLRTVVTISALRIGFTVIMERFLDIVMTLLLLVVIASAATISDDIRTAAGIFLGVTLLLFLAGAATYRYGPRLTRAAAGTSLSGVLEEYRRTIDTILHRRPAMALLLSGVCVILSTAIVWAVLTGFDRQATIWSAMLVTVTITFAMAIPSAPANIGVFQLAGQLALVSLPDSRFTPAAALAAVSVVHAIHFAGTTLFGLIGFWYLHRRIATTGPIRSILKKLFRRLF